MSTLPNPPNPNSPAPAPAGPGPHKEPSDAEEIYYEGSPPVRGLGIHVLLWPLAGLVLVILPFLLHSHCRSCRC
jgi:hypothetical protein